jgi:hypothetical protein
MIVLDFKWSSMRPFGLVASLDPWLEPVIVYAASMPHLLTFGRRILSAAAPGSLIHEVSGSGSGTILPYGVFQPPTSTVRLPRIRRG